VRAEKREYSSRCSINTHIYSNTFVGCPTALTAISDHLIFPRETTLLSASHPHLSATNCASNCLFCALGGMCPPRCDGIASGGRDGRRHQGDSCAHPRFGTVLGGGSRGIERQDISSRSDLEPRRDGHLSLDIASHCLSLPLIAAHVHVEAAPCGRRRSRAPWRSRWHAPVT